MGAGLALARRGEFGDAHDAFAKALEVDPNSDLAHADLAGLRCRFGDAEGARAELQKIHAAPETSALLDPDWQRCR